MQGTSTAFARLWLLTLFVAACGSSSAKPDSPSCTDGQLTCVGQESQQCQAGTFVTVETCLNVCNEVLGCVACEPGAAVCDGSVSRVCAPDGSGTVEYDCDPVQGLTCDQATGQCQGACAPTTLGSSYIGCDYYPTVTANAVNNAFNFAVTISNATSEPAQVTIEGGALTAPLTLTVAAAAVQVQTLPWVNPLKACTTTGGGSACLPVQRKGALAAGGGYRLRSTRPVSVYQFSPLEYMLPGGQLAQTNDASLLLPATAMTGRYVVASWQRWIAAPGQGISPGFMAITATRDGTTVNVTTRANTVADQGAPAFTAGVPQAVTLNRGDVLQLQTETGDLSGSRVDADKPVQVIGGHFCAQIPADTLACDHLEESVFPLETLATRYLVAPPAIPNFGKLHHVRIIATEDATQLTYNPAQTAPTSLARAGDFIDLAAVTGEFEVIANRRVLVVQYMSSEAAVGGTGDPSMAIVAPVEQYRSSYLFHAPLSYQVNFVNIIAPLGASVILDGQPVTGFEPIGTTNFGIRRHQIAAGGNGNHVATGDVPFGITVYGYGIQTSYWYVGGLDLKPIVIQ